MNIDTFFQAFNSEIQKSSPDQIADDPVSFHEHAMRAAGFDFTKDSEQLLEEFILPGLEEVKKEILDYQEKALGIYREAGVDELKIRWGNFSNAELNVFQRRQLKRIKNAQVELIDMELGLSFMQKAIYRNRPDLKEKYGEGELILIGD